jgi:hypothetical protein
MTAAETMTKVGWCRFGHCSACRLPVHLHPDPGGTPVAMQPGHFLAAELPTQIHRHLRYGVMQLGADAGEFGTVRIEHAEVCPARERPADPVLADIHHRLGMRPDCLKDAA